MQEKAETNLSFHPVRKIHTEEKTDRKLSNLLGITRSPEGIRMQPKD